MSDGCRGWTAGRLTRFVPAAMALTLVSSGCASRALPPVAPEAFSPATRLVAPHPPPSVPTLASIETAGRVSDDLVARGEALLDAGRFDGARLQFDRALRLLMELPPDSLAPGRLGDVIDRISALELSAYADAAGHAAARGRQASVDDRLAIVTFEREAAADTDAAVDPELAVLPDVPVPMNARVKSAIQALSVRRHDVVAAGLTRAGRYLPMIREELVRQGLPPDLAFLPLVESSYKPAALSRASARGMWQFMRGTARENGLRQDWYIDERDDPEKSTGAAAQYLRTLYRMFDGDWHLTLAAYNAGPGRVQRALRRSGAHDFWTLSASGRFLPQETRNYVPLALAAMTIGRDPGRYGLDVTPDPPLTYAKVSVPHAIDLDRVAEWSGTSLEVIRSLNPELRRWMTPFGHPDYELKVPTASADVLSRRVAAAAPSDLITPRWHVVGQGESLWRIARAMNISRVDLAAANRLSPSARLRIGQRLLIPGGPEAPRVVDAEVNGPQTSGSPGFTAPASQNGTYRVQAGDTLFRIARLFRTTVDSLKRWNRLRSNLIKPGDRLTILGR